MRTGAKEERVYRSAKPGGGVKLILNEGKAQKERKRAKAEAAHTQGSAERGIHQEGGSMKGPRKGGETGIKRIFHEGKKK